MKQTEGDGGPNQQPRVEASSEHTRPPGQPAWDTASASAEEEGAALEDVGQSTDQEGEWEKVGEEEMRTVGPDGESNTTAASLPGEPEQGREAPQSSNGSVPPAGRVQQQAEVFVPQDLQTVGTGCEVPNQRTALESSQVGRSKCCKSICTILCVIGKDLD